MSRWSRVIVFLASIILICGPSAAESPTCQAPVLKSPPVGANIFTEDQEMVLSSLLHQKLEQDVVMIEDESLTGELKRVGDRLLQALPKTNLRFHYYIIDIPIANALSEAGGNIYFSRKMIASFRSEDELAAVMAHEMGHIVTHQSAIEISREMKAVLGTSQLTDADDVEDKYNQLLDSYRKKPGAFRHRDSEAHDQLNADQVSAFAVAAAGYDVKMMAAFFDRFTENKGKTGNFFTDMFGGTSEEQRRFRDMLKNTKAISADCIGKHSETSDVDFSKWKTAVLAYDGIGHQEKLDGLIARKPLAPPLRAELTKMRVSPDGNYVFAQDTGSIAVMTREDLKPLFRIDAEEARSVQFTADSKAISFYKLDIFTSPRVEVWDIEDKLLRAAYELHIPIGCNQAALSPDAKYFACIYPDAEQSWEGLFFSLRILNTESGETIFEKKQFFGGDRRSVWTHLWGAIFSGEELRVVSMHFSPDSKYLLWGREDQAVAIDVASGTKLNLPNSIKEIMHVDFTFLDGDRIVGPGGKGDKGAVIKFPSGEVLYSNLKMGLAHLDGASRGDYVIVFPLKDYAAGLFDLKKNEYVFGSKVPAIEVYGDEYLHERRDGELEIVNLGSGKPKLQKPLAEGPLGRVVASAASDDLNYVAISGTVRGAVWNVNQGTRVMHLRRFNAVGVDNAGFTFADFPAEGESKKRQFAQVNTAKGTATSFQVDEEGSHEQIGAYLLEAAPTKKGDWGKNVLYQVKSMRSNAVLWSRTFQNGLPRTFVEDDIDSLVFAYDVNNPAGKAAMQGNDELNAKVKALKTRDHAYAIESVDLPTGKTKGVMALDTGKGSFLLRDAFRAGPYIVTTDTHDRVQVFSLDGTRKGRLEAHGAMGTRDGRVLAISVGRGKLAIYDLQAFKKVNELDFALRLAMFRFSSDSSRLLVITRDQKAYYFDTKQLLAGPQVAVSK